MVGFCHAYYHRWRRPLGSAQAAQGRTGAVCRHRARARSRRRTARGRGAVPCSPGGGTARRAFHGGRASSAEFGAGSRPDRAGQALTADTSVVVAALSAWHEQHDVAARALERVTVLPAHVMLEAYSVLTRLPGGLAVPAATAADVLGRRFHDPPLELPRSNGVRSSARWRAPAFSAARPTTGSSPFRLAGTCCSRSTGVRRRRTADSARRSKSSAEASAVRAPPAHGRLAPLACAVGGELGAGEEEAAAGVVELAGAGFLGSHVGHLGALTRRAG